MTDIPAHEIRAQVDRMLASPGFIDAGLKLLVDNALIDHTQSAPGAEILRPRLKEYYAGEGKDDPVVIEIPPGASIPVFRRSSAPVGYQPTAGRKLFMMGLCVVALIIVWVFYFVASKQSP